MKDELLPVYRAVAEGRMTKAEALAHIRALKNDAPRAGSAAETLGLLLAADDWQAMPAGGDGVVPREARPFDRVLVWGVPQAVFDSLKAQRRDAVPLGALQAELPPADGDSDGLAERYAQAMRDGFEAIRALLGGASAQPGTASARRLLLAIADDADAVFANGFAAMCRTAMEENPTLQLRCVHVPAGLDADGLAQALDDEGHADAARGALVRRRRGQGEAWVREVAGWRVVERQPHGDAQASPALEHIVFREGGCYLITGGAGGIGLEFAREIVRRTRRARVLLAGRSAPSPHVRREIEALARDGHEVEHLRLDVTRGDEVDALVARLQAQGRTLDGIVHCAGITRDSFVIRKSVGDFTAVLAPKVAGLAHLDRATRGQPLDFLLLCSSFAACWGIVGQVDYAAANAFMDAFATRRNRLAAAGLRSGRTLSVDWPLWQDGGMRIDASTRARLQSHTGMQPLSTASAMLALHRGLSLDLDRMLVMEGDLPRMLALLDGRAVEASSHAPTQAPAAPAPRAATTTVPSVPHVASAPAAAGGADFDAKVLEYITRQFSQVLKIPASKLRPQAPLEQYGIDSLLAMKLVTHLESIFGKLPKTLAFEYQTIAQMCDYFRAEHGPRLSELLLPAPTSQPQADVASPATRAASAPATSEPAAPRAAAATGGLGRRPSAASSAPSAAVPRSSMPAVTDAVTASVPVAAPTAVGADTLPSFDTDEPIAIVGLSGRYPEAWDLDAYWRNLAEGRDCIREVPAERWRWQDYYREPSPGAALDAGAHSSRWGGFIEGADEFDARFFNVTPRDAEQIDPQERLFLQHAWMAIEDAGYTRAGLQALRGGQVGVYAGVMYGEYNRSGSLASIANRVSYVLNVHGPSMTLDTMCSSSLTAIHLACQDLRSGRTDMALAGGVNLSLHPGKYSMLSAGQFISTAGQCQSFGEGGDGYIPGEGVGVVVLKRLSDAERDGDAIHAVIRGSALNHGGKTNGYTVPNPQAQAAVVSEALKVSGVDARHVSYIEAHGTGTKLGDPIEIAALGKAFREYTQESGFCWLGSAKSNIGHCESAAGIAGLTKVVLQLRHRRIVPSLHSAKLNPNIDFDTTPFVVNQTLREWEAPVLDGRVLPRIAGLSSFGAGGANAHIVIEEYTAPAAGAGATVGMPAGLPLLVSLSARTFEQLRGRVQDLRAVLASGEALDLAAMAWTLHVGREAMDARLGIRADSREDLIDKLDAFLAAGEPEDGALADDVHYAQTRRHRDMVEMFEADADLRASVDQWFATGKFARLLEMWTKGLDVDWRRLYGANPPRRMHLPVYPFARERYWRDEPLVGIAQVQRSADALHSLLHRNASRPGLQRYRSDFASADPRVSALRRHGQGSLPHALQLEAARVALTDALSEGGASWSLCDVRFGAPMAVDGDWPVSVSVLLPGQGERPSLSLAAFEVGLGDDGNGVLCQGLAERVDGEGTSAPIPAVDIGTLLAQASPLFADRAALLAAERGIGLDVDAPYRVVESIHRTRDGLLLRLETPADTAAHFADCAIPPAALDAALRAAVWLAPSSHQPWLPAGLSRLRLAGPVSGAAPRYAVLRVVAQAADALELTLTLCSEHGGALLHIDGLQLHPAVLQALPERSPLVVPAKAPAQAPVQGGSTPVASPARDTRALPTHREAVRFRAGAVAASTASTQLSLLAESSPQTSGFAAPALAKPAGVSLLAPTQSAAAEPRSPRAKPALALIAPAAQAGTASSAAGQPASATVSDRGAGVFALRLDTGNRLDGAAVDVLSQALAHAAELPELRLLLIEAGEGGLPAARDPALDAQDVERLLRTLAAFPLPTAAVLSGDAFGIGLRLACTCDVLVAVEDGRYGFVGDAGNNVGPEVGPGSAQAWMAARFGEPLASHLAFAERAFDGRELQAAGLGCLLVARHALDATVDALGRSLADKSPAVLRTLKSHLAREFAAAVAAFDAQSPAQSDAPAVVADAADAAHPAILLEWTAPGRARLTLRAGVAADDAGLLRQLVHALHACREAAVLCLYSEIDGFLPEAAATTGDALDAVLAAMAGLRMPVVAVVEHGARDAGLLLALACDRMLCGPSGEYGGIDLQAHRTRLGTVEALLARRAGARGREWLLSGQRFDGAALRQAMPLLPVSAPDALAARVDALAERLAALPREFARKSLPVQPVVTSPTDDEAALAAAEQGDLVLSSDVVRAHVDADGVVLLRLEDRQARNMFSDALIAGVQEAFARIGRLPNARAVVVVGYDTYFASGGTQSGLKAIQEGRVRFTDLDIFQSALRCPLPVVAAMQGHGIGAGWTLGLFCDCLLFGAESRYLSPYMNFGFTPGAGATGILPEKLGYDLARYSLFTGEEITGETLARRNPSLSVLPRDQVLEAALALARSIARHPRADLVAWKAATVGHRFDAWQALLAREVEMHEATLVGQADALDRIERGFGAASQPAAVPVATPVSAAVSLPAASAAPARSQPEILATIRRLLAEELRIAESEIDPQTAFVDLGLDSISSVTWIRRINESFGLSIEATQVYNHPNLQKLARFVGDRMPAAAAPEAAAPAPAVPVVPAPAMAVPNLPAAPARAVSPGPAARSAPAVSVDLGAVRRVLVELLAEELRQTPDSIDPEVGFVDLGLDSISGVTWIRGVNQRYGTAIEATKVYTYPTIAKFTRYLHGLLVEAASSQGGAPDAALPADAPAPAGQGASMTVANDAGGRPSTVSMTSGFDWPPLSTWVRVADPAAGPVAAGTTAASSAASLQAHPAEIAIIGMAGRFPMAADVDAFWENIASGRNCISEVPETRWDTRAYYVDGQPTLGQSNSKWMGVLEGHDRFDPQFFGLSPLEAEAMDPQQRLFLECCWHGMEDAGYTSERLSGSRCGVFVGCAYGDYNLLSREQQINALGFTGGATSILAARVSYFMNLQGPCVSIDTACSSSLVAIASACDSLVTGGADMAFAGGVYVMANADMFLKTAHAGMLSPDGRCYTFDQRANGFVPGEAVGVVMLKRLADAERDGDNILGVLRGWGVNQDGRTNGITAPNAESQQRLMSDVYKRFDIDPEQIQLIEAHGTGTKLGDPIEVEGLKAAFLPATQRKGYCAIGSVKTNIGHCLTAAGTSGVIKLLLSLRHKALPPSINFERPNEHLDLDDSPFYVNTMLRDWAVPPGVTRQAAISSFGFSGTNAHLVLAEYVPPAAAAVTVAETAPPQGGVIVALSARNAERLRRRAEDLRAFVQATPDLDLASMACTLQLHRDAMDERLCFVARSAQDVLAGLGAYIDGKPSAAGLSGSVFAGNIRQGRESVRLLNEDPAMAALVVEKCIADAQYSRLCELWVKGLALDWRALYGTRKPPMMALPKYPFAEESYWISVDQAAFAPAAPAVDRSGHLHPLLQAKVADLCDLGYRPATGGGEVAGRSTQAVKAIHLPTYAFARMRCWIPTKEEVAALAGTASDGRADDIPPSGRLLQNLDSVAALFAELEQDRLTAEEVTARVKQLA